MILLLEPARAPDFVSGGYRYQAEIGRRLSARGDGELQAISPRDLESVVAAARAQATPPTIVVDGLFAEHGLLPAGTIALLHTVPRTTPWSRGPLPVIATSQLTADAVGGPATHTAVVRPGLDACFAPVPVRRAGSPLRIVCVGTLCPAKGQRLVAEALAGWACELVLLGCDRSDPDYVGSVRRAAAGLPIQVPGARPPESVAAELRAADLFVSASRKESFGMAVAEAAACGVPVLAFNTGEIDSFVHDGENGWLVAPDADDPSFAARLRALVARSSDLDRARTLARAPNLASWDVVTDRFVAACRAPAR